MDPRRRGGDPADLPRAGHRLRSLQPAGTRLPDGAIKDDNTLAAGDWRRQNPSFQEGNVEQNRALVDAVTELAQARGCTPAQLALAWLLAQGPDIVPIPGTRRVTRLDENAGAARISLDDSELQRIAAVLEAHAVAGTRYPAAGMASLNV